jgi:hypothetical protein
MGFGTLCSCKLGPLPAVQSLRSLQSRRVDRQRGKVVLHSSFIYLGLLICLRALARLPDSYLFAFSRPFAPFFATFATAFDRGRPRDGTSFRDESAGADRHDRSGERNETAICLFDALALAKASQSDLGHPTHQTANNISRRLIRGTTVRAIDDLHERKGENRRAGT